MLKKFFKLALIILFLSNNILIICAADISVKKLVYKIYSFNGQGYSQFFSWPDSDEIYIFSNNDTFLIPVHVEFVPDINKLLWNLIIYDDVSVLGGKLVLKYETGNILKLNTVLLSNKPDILICPAEKEKYNFNMSPLYKAFPLKLKKGEYQLKIYDAAQNEIRNASKKIIVFEKEGPERIAYSFFNNRKGQIADESIMTFSVLYINNKECFDGYLYLYPFKQISVNEFYYNKAFNNSIDGNYYKNKWIKTGNVLNGRIEAVHTPNVAEVFLEDLYIFKDIPDSECNSDIGPLELKYFAYRIPIPNKSASFRLQDETGYYYPGSEREVRIVCLNDGHVVILLIFAFFPLLIVITMIIFRKFKKGIK